MGEDKVSSFDREASLALKGIATLMLLTHHCFLRVSAYEGYGVLFFPFGERQVVKAAVACKMCVAIFAFISGYGLFLDYQKHEAVVSTTKWCLRRYVRTFSGYWFIWIVLALVGLVPNGSTIRTFSQGNNCLTVAYAVINLLGLSKLFDTPTLYGSWWYMSAAAVYIVVLPFLYKLRNELGIVLISHMMLLRVLFEGNPSEAFPGNNSIYAFMMPFLIGCIFARYGLFDKWIAVGRKSSITKLYKIVVEVWIVLIVIKIYHDLPLNKFWEIHYALLPLIIILFCVEFVVIVPRLREALWFVGRHSMNVFLIHAFILGHFKRYIMVPRHFMLIVLCLLLVSIGGSILIETAKGLIMYNQFVKRIETIIIG